MRFPQQETFPSLFALHQQFGSYEIAFGIRNIHEEYLNDGDFMDLFSFNTFSQFVRDVILLPFYSLNRGPRSTQDRRCVIKELRYEERETAQSFHDDYLMFLFSVLVSLRDPYLFCISLSKYS